MKSLKLRSPRIDVTCIFFLFLDNTNISFWRWPPLKLYVTFRSHLQLKTDAHAAQLVNVDAFRPIYRYAERVARVHPDLIPLSNLFSKSWPCARFATRTRHSRVWCANEPETRQSTRMRAGLVQFLRIVAVCQI